MNRASKTAVIGGLIALAAITTTASALGAQRARKPAPTATVTQASGALKINTGQAGSVVFINNVRHGTTTDKGELDLPRVRAGSYPMRVRTVGYAAWNGPVIIA